jgi:hypothetical protein
MSRVTSLGAIQRLLQQALDKTEALHENCEEIENPTDASERTVEACEEIEQALCDAIVAIVAAIADLTP